HLNVSSSHRSCQNFYLFVACWTNSACFKDATCETLFSFFPQINNL
ncbi:unnamed protein product, partial [Gulo gulo]